jgi:Xaa-Pro dipeptidase
MSSELFLADLLSDYKLDAIALIPGQSLTYLTGLHFHTSERPVTLMVSKADALIILPELEAGKVNQSKLPLKAVTFNDNPASWQNAFREAIQILGLARGKIGVETTKMRFQELSFLKEAAPLAIISSADSLLGTLRIQKKTFEIQAIRQAVKIAEEALQTTLPMIQPGVTEAQICFDLNINLIRAGSAGGSSFEAIIAAGPNAANPHASVSDRPLQSGDLLIIDWGATYHDYISDLTRTFAIGPVAEELSRIVEVVHRANAAGRTAGKPGVTAGSVDQATRAVIQQAGYGEYFIHRTGHGIGMEVHEPPYIFAENDLLLAPGMAYTIEPGIYLPGHAGVRIEDNVIITELGCDVLSSLPRELIQLPLRP